MTRRACRSWLRALKRWTPQPASLWRVLFPDIIRQPHGGPFSGKAGW
jgi:hypothetical protein